MIDKIIKDFDQDPLDDAISIDDVFNEKYEDEDEDDIDDPDSDDDFERRWYPD